MSSCGYLCLCQGRRALRATLRSARSALVFIVELIVVFMLVLDCVRGGPPREPRFARLAQRTFLLWKIKKGGKRQKKHVLNNCGIQCGATTATLQLFSNCVYKVLIRSTAKYRLIKNSRAMKDNEDLVTER